MIAVDSLIRGVNLPAVHMKLGRQVVTPGRTRNASVGEARRVDLHSNEIHQNANIASFVKQLSGPGAISLPGQS